jgi:hypothetical protein
MFRLVSFAILAILVLTASGLLPVRAAGGDQDVKAIIAKAIEAKGGEANIHKYNGSVSTFKGILTINGMSANMTGTTKEQMPDKLRLDAVMKQGTQTVNIQQIINGNKGWQGINGQFQELDKAAIADAHQEFHAGQVSDLRGLNGKGVKLTALGESKVEGRPAVGVKVTAEGFRDVSLYFDKANSELLKAETIGSDPMAGGQFKAESFYSDYKKVNGVSVPFKVKVLRDGKPFMEMEMTSVKLSERLDDKEFAKP